MGAMAAPPLWIPEDDLLLKNAVEAGASLESLAKGAVCFSRRFTLQELKERWQSLLYDPEVSAEASAHMIEFEIELSSSNPPKATRACSLKGKDSSSEKRKGDSIKSHYFSWRKRKCNRPYTSIHQDLPEAFCSEIIKSCSYACEDGINIEYQQHQSDGITLPEHKANYFGNPGMGYDNDQSIFPGMSRFNPVDSSDHIVRAEFHNECTGSMEDRYMERISGNNPLPVSTKNLCLEADDKTLFNDTVQSMENRYIQKDHYHVVRQNLVAFDVNSEVHEIKQAKNLPTSNQYVCQTSEAKPLIISASSDDKHSGTFGDDNGCMQMSDCGDSFHQLGFSSQTAELPLWSTIPGNSSEIMALNMHLSLNNDNRSDMIHQSITPHDLDSCTYMDFDDDDDFLLDNLDDIDSILLDSPSDSYQDDLPNSIEPKEAKIFPMMPEIPDVSHFEDIKYNGVEAAYGLHNDHTDSNSEKCAISTFPKAFRSAKPLERLPLCILNTEDPEIPCNDHISIPAELQSPCAASVDLLSVDGKRLTEDYMPTMEEEELLVIQTPTSFLEENSSGPINVGLTHTVNDCVKEFEASEEKLANEVPRDSLINSTIQSSCMLQDMHSSPEGTLKKENVNLDLQKHVSFDASVVLPCEKLAPELDLAITYSQNVASDCKKELNMQATLHKCASLTDLSLPQSVAAMSTSDPDERLSDSEDDVPNFSDIEEMILDMDLGPYDPESCLFNQEVSQYQPIHSKKTIIRLEQGARAYTNRIISSHGAFAVFYGHHLKYFIRTPQVSLGRATEDVKVEIDLCKEGRANKISRRQAIIKMDDDGSFLLRNIGKYSIFLNSRELASQKCVNLTSGSLIEIRNLRFIFDVNQSAVRKYITTLRKRLK